MPPMGGGTVEVDEAYFGHLDGQPKKGRFGTSNMNTVLTLVERGGSSGSFHIDSNRIADIAPILRANLSREAKLMTDEHASYKGWVASLSATMPPTAAKNSMFVIGTK